MTTKIKIILGFTAMILLMVTLSFFGYRGLQTASDNFDEYRRLARFNVLASDMVSDMAGTAALIFQFTSTDDTSFLEGIEKNMASMNERIKQADDLIRQEERRATLAMVAQNSKLLQDAVNGVKTALLGLLEQYDNMVEPSSDDMKNVLDDLHESALSSGNITGARLSAAALRRTNDAALVATGLSQSRSTEEYPGTAEFLDELKKSLDELAPALVSPAEKAAITKLLQDYDKMSSGMLAIVEHSDAFQEYLASINAIGDSSDAALLELSGQVNEDMDKQGPLSLRSNSNAQTTMLGISAGGLLAGVLLAAFIVLGIVRVLKELDIFAEAIAAGNFDHEVTVREKGEVGAMISAMKQIPEALNTILEEYKVLEAQVEHGSLGARADASAFKGDFATLVKGTNSILERFMLVLESIPSPVVMLDKDLKAAYINAQARDLAGEDYKGKSCFELLARDDFNSDSCGLKRAVSTKKSASGETSAHPQGRDMDISYTAIPMYSKDGSLAAVLQLITDLTAIKQTQRTIMNVAAQAADVSNRVAAASEELSAQVEQVSRGADMQRARVDSTATAMTEMNATVLEVAKSAGQASQQSELTRSKADNGAQLVNQVVEAINVVNKVAVGLQENMQELGSQAESIGGVMNIISDIADQTNLLALNAAIEAARAGEAGRGFAVVADEVRKLAEKTMSATSEVGGNISSIQNSAKSNIEAMEEASRAVTEATNLAGSSGSALSEIVDLASSNSAVVASIATAAEEQSATSEEINMAINEINQIVGETAEGMVQASSAVQELSQMAQELNRIMEELK